LRIGAGIVSVFGATAIAAPQGATNAAAQDNERAESLEEVVVTARKREESLQEVPIAVTAFSEQALESIGARGLEDIALRTPGVQFNEQAGQIPGRFNCSIRFRGMNVNTEQPVAQLGALFIDGVFIASGCNSIGAEDLQRVEVVKGPQAVYFGRNTFGGAVNYVTRDPGYDWKSKVTLSYAEDSDTEYTFGLEGPIVDEKLSFRVAGRYYDRDGIYGTTADGSDLGEQKTRSLAAKFVWKPNDALTFKLRGQYSEDRDGPPGAGFISGRLNDTCTGTTGPSGQARARYICGEIPGIDQVRTANPSGIFLSYNTSLTPNSLVPNRGAYLSTQLLNNGAADPALNNAIALDYFGLKRNNLFVGFTGDYDLPNDWTVSAVYGHNKMRSNWLRDFDWTEAEAWWSTDPQNLEDDTMELRLTSAQNGPLSWVIGAAYYEMEYTQSGNGGTVVTSAGVPGGRIPLTFNNSLVNNVVQEYSALFGGVTWKFSDRWSVSAEARYQEDTIEKGQIIAGQLQAMGVNIPVASQEWQDVLPRVILQWQPSAETNLYASFSVGVLPGDINAEYIFGPDNMRTLEQIQSGRAQTVNGAPAYPQIGLLTPALGVPNAQDFIDREKLDSFEIGWKQQWLDGALQTTAALYFMKWENQKGRVSTQVVDFNGNSNAPFVRDAATCVTRTATDLLCNDTLRTIQITVPGSSELRGLELEGNWRVNDRWTVQAGLDYTNNEYTDFTFNFVEPLAGTRDMRGNSSPRYPEWKGNIAASYTRPLAREGWNFFARSDLLYFGDYFVDESNLATAPAQTLLSMRVGVGNERVRLEVFGQNLTDEDAYASASRWTDFTTPAVASTANQGVAVTPQREQYFGVKATFNF
jgi:iron complex outermembrane receptor protein